MKFQIFPHCSQTLKSLRNCQSSDNKAIGKMMVDVKSFIDGFVVLRSNMLESLILITPAINEYYPIPIFLSRFLLLLLLSSKRKYKS